jgi:tetratricopeptide (TPR) repeat protein
MKPERKSKLITMTILNLIERFLINSSFKRTAFLFLLSFFPLFMHAQSSGKLLHDGNKLYQQKKYNEAEINYRKSLEKKENPFIGNYNLGNAYYQQGKLEDAKRQFEISSGMKSSKQNQSAAFHNLGNTLLKDKKYAESIQAYKEALKINPADNDTRYNLAYAQSMLQQQQQQQKNDKNNKDNKDQKDNQKDQQQKENQQKQDQQKQQQKEEQAKQEEGKQEQAKKDKISKDDAEKILQALNNEEKKTQKKLNIKEHSRVVIDKEW